MTPLHSPSTPASLRFGSLFVIVTMQGLARLRRIVTKALIVNSGWRWGTGRLYVQAWDQVIVCGGANISSNHPCRDTKQY